MVTGGSRRGWLGGSRLTLAHGLMVAAGLLTFVLVSSVLRSREATVEVVVAAADLAPGTVVSAADFAVVDVSADDPLVPVLTTSLPVGSLLSSPLSAGEPLLQTDVVDAGAVAGERTFTVSVESMVVDGLGLTLGDRVDVIGVGPDGRTVYVAVDVAVTRLPAGRESSAFAAAASRESWVTLAVDEAQALALSSAQRAGDVELVRSTGAAPIELPSQSNDEIDADSEVTP